MNSRHLALTTFVPIALLCGCAGPPPPGSPDVAPIRQAPMPPAAAAVPDPKAHRFYIVTFDAQGTPHDRTGAVVTRDRALTLIARKEIDAQTGIRIEVPKGITDHDQSIAAFARAQQVAKIFDLLGFEAVVVVLAQ